MITILHGDDENKIHSELSKIISNAKLKNVQVTRIDAKGLSLPEFESVLGTQELFTLEKIVIIDRLHGMVKSKVKDNFIDLVASQQNSEIHLVLLENKNLTATQLKKFPTAQVSVFKLPMLLFSFVDMIGTTSSAKLITIFHQIIQTQDAEFVFAMMLRQIRILIAFVSDGSYSGASFGRSKIERQSRSFSLEKLFQLHTKLLTIDIGQKTSRSALSMTQEIDLMLSQM